MTKKQKKELKRIIIAIVIYAVLMLVDRLDLYPIHPNQWVTFLLFLVPYLIVGLEVLAGAVHGIRNKQMLDETFLMTLATFGAFAAGEYSEGVAVMLFYQVGEFFQDYAVNRSRNSIKELMDISPEIANVEREDGTIETIDPDEVEIGDTLVVKPGEKIPVDGIVLEGSSRLNTSALTGESVPRSVQRGLYKSSMAVIHKLQGKEGLLPLQKKQKNPISLPELQIIHLLLVDPFELAFIALDRFSRDLIRSEKRHIFGHTVTGNEGDKPAIMKGNQVISRFLLHLTLDTFLRTFIPLEMPADTDPFILIYIILFDDPMQEKIFSVLFDITKCA